MKQVSLFEKAKKPKQEPERHQCAYCHQPVNPQPLDAAITFGECWYHIPCAVKAEEEGKYTSTNK